MTRKLLSFLYRLDVYFCIKIFRLTGKKSIDRIMFAFSHFGYGYAYPFIGIFVIIFDFSNSRSLISAGFISFFIEHTTHKLIKIKTRRIRPFKALPEIHNLIRPPDEFSFPSGHAAGAFMMATLLNHFYPSLTLLCYIIAVIIAMSRIYNGVHYPSDVIAGSFLGIFSARTALIIV